MNPDLKQQRIDLACALRWAARLNLHEGVANHFSLAVPDEEGIMRGNRFLINPYGWHWSEVTASSLVLCNDKGEVLEGDNDVEDTAFFIHSRIHMGAPHAICVLHTHMPYASALTRLEDQKIQPIGQTELGTMMKTGYDDSYDGPGLDPAEGARLAKACGKNTVMLMANHGALTLGKNVAEAYDRLYYLERVAQVQLYAMWTGRPLRELPAPVVEKTYKTYRGSAMKYGGRSNAEWHFDALKRILDRKEPDYAH